MANTKLKHILESQQFDRSWIEKILFPEADQMRKMVSVAKIKPYLKDKSICLLFYEPSTRTRLSFQNAGLMLGARVAVTENAKEFSSAVKGESLKDTIRTVNALGFNAIVIRSDVEGGATEAASVSNIPIINAGDAAGQHPTQSLLDLYTIYRHFGKVDGLKIALVGDCKNSRTHRSLAYLLGKFKKITLFLVAPKEFQMRPDILDYLDRHKILYKQVPKLTDVAGNSDVVCLTRLQKERLNGQNIKFDGSGVRLTREILSQLPKNSIITHVLPRSNDFNELPEEFTNDRRIIIFKQVENGLFIRMALLKLILTP